MHTSFGRDSAVYLVLSSLQNYSSLLYDFNDTVVVDVSPVVVIFGGLDVIVGVEACRS